MVFLEAGNNIVELRIHLELWNDVVGHLCLSMRKMAFGQAYHLCEKLFFFSMRRLIVVSEKRLYGRRSEVRRGFDPWPRSANGTSMEISLLQEKPSLNCISPHHRVV